MVGAGARFTISTCLPTPRVCQRSLGKGEHFRGARGQEPGSLAEQPRGGLDGAQGCGWAGPSFRQVEGGVRWTHFGYWGWKLRCSIWVGLPCRGPELAVSCRDLS